MEYLLVSFALLALGSASGCGGGVTSSVSLDEDAKARVQANEDNMKKAFAKKKAAAASEKKKPAGKR